MRSYHDLPHHALVWILSSDSELFLIPRHDLSASYFYASFYPYDFLDALGISDGQF